MPDRSLPRPTLFRAVLLALGVGQIANGVWATFFPRSFYDDFPAGAGGWVAALPSYSEHLVVDIGSLFLGTGVLMVAAGVWLERRLVAVALVTWVAWSLPHTVFHMLNLDALETGDAVAQSTVLIVTLVVPLALLGMLRRRPADAPRAAGRAPAGGAARLEGVERPRNPLVRNAYAQTRRQFGRVLEPIKVKAHAPSVLLGYGAFELATKRSTHVDERTKELAVLKAAQLGGCEWCLDVSTSLLRSHGVTDEEMRAVLDYRSSDVLSDRDKLVLEYAEGMTRTPIDVPDELFERLRARFDEAQIVELTSIIALENYRARFNWALGIESEGFTEGAYCVPPAAPRDERREGATV